MRSTCGFVLLAAVLVGLAPAVTAQEPSIPVGYSTGYHTVRPGENLRRITKNYLGSEELWRSNWGLNSDVKDPDFLLPGQRIRVLLSSGHAVPTAQVVTISGTVDERPDPIAWTPAQRQDLIVERDGVRTSVASSAALRFPDGTRLVVTEDSIVFFKEAGRTLRGIETRSVEIVEGQADLAGNAVSEGGAEIEFLIGDATTKPTAGPSGKSEARMRKSQAGSAQLMIYEGESKVEAGGKTVSVAQGMGTSVPKGSPPLPPEKLLPMPVLGTPEGGGDLEVGRLEFAWDGVEGAAGYTIEVCSDEPCEALVARAVGLTATTWAEGDLPPGDFHWRVTAVSPSGLDGYPASTRRLSVLPARVEFDAPTAAYALPSLAVHRTLEGETRTFYAPTARVGVSVEDPSGVASWQPLIDGEPAEKEALRGGWSHGVHTVTVRAEDKLGNHGEGERSVSFTVDGEGPELTWRIGGAELLEELYGGEGLENPQSRRWLKRGARRNSRRGRKLRTPGWTLLAWGNENVDSSNTFERERKINGLYRSYSGLRLTGESPFVVLLAPGIRDPRADGAGKPGDFLVLEAVDGWAGVEDLTVTTSGSVAGGYELRARARDRLGNVRSATWDFNQ